MWMAGKGLLDVIHLCHVKGEKYNEVFLLDAHKLYTPCQSL